MFLYKLSNKHSNFYFFDNNAHVTGKDFTRYGIHLNNLGKRKVALNLKEKICDLYAYKTCQKPISVVINNFKNTEQNFLLNIQRHVKQAI